jgi:ATP-dependent protease ClpP protease subunit
MIKTNVTSPQSLIANICKKMLYLMCCAVGLASLIDCRSAIAADITRERGVSSQPDVIRINGQINLGDEDRFRVLALESKNAIVYLESPGGRVQPALEIGTIIRLKGFETAVEDGQCSSACAFIWLAGEPRMMSNFSSIGFHAPYVTGKDGTRTSSAAQGARIASYLSRLGFSEKVVMFALQAGSEEMQWLQKSTADSLGIAVNMSTEFQRLKAYELFSMGLKLSVASKPSIEEAAKFYRSSADLGFAGAQNNLGDLYEIGESVIRNQKAAIYWYTRAAERGEPTAYFSLASLLSEGTTDPEILADSMKFATLAFMFLPDGINKDSAGKLASAIGAKLTEGKKADVLESVNRWVPLFQENRLMGDKPKKLNPD